MGQSLDWTAPILDAKSYLEYHPVSSVPAYLGLDCMFDRLSSIGLLLLPICTHGGGGVALPLSFLTPHQLASICSSYSLAQTACGAVFATLSPLTAFVQRDCRRKEVGGDWIPCPLAHPERVCHTNLFFCSLCLLSSAQK